MSENRRTATRHPVDLPCALREGAMPEVRINNLSVGGALIVHPKLPMGHRLHLSFRVPAVPDQEISIGAVVRWCTDHEVGVQFDGLRPKDVWALSKYFESL
ncbi:MAG: PilZ domain-containing protein [Myxococcales bacterium]|nr:PilZ domain-containing protein [Myxococcales bacterium]